MTTLSPSPQISDHDRTRLRTGSHHAPHDILGSHAVEGGTVVHTLQPGARRVTLLTESDSIPMKDTGDHIFSLFLPYELGDYRYLLHYDDETITIADGYHILPTVGELDQHLINEGTHTQLWKVLGAHERQYSSPLGLIEGTSFAVWAPHAAGVSVISDANGWNPYHHPMRALGSSGIWEVFIPGISAGALYKFSILTADGVRIDKADPLAFRAEPAPATASIVERSSYQWNDEHWLDSRANKNWNEEAISIYELHLGSWKPGQSYLDMVAETIDYVTSMGYTHVELMGISQHPFLPSWGYQVTSYYAPNNRLGTPDELRALIDSFHRAGIAVIMDWVPGHFPRDSWALGRFDGSACYEHPDPRRGEQPDWGTYIFNFGRHEVRNFLVANALYWCQEFHIDGLRVDAVASMLYLDYSREEGQWLPNIYGGREHLEAVQFLREMNDTIHRLAPGTITIAEESTSWPGVTAPTTEEGLGFDFKWNMGWMHDSLEYVHRDPLYRSHHHGEITFSMVYAYSEKYVLPISHDEVVHGKGTLWSRMPADSAWDKAAQVRSFLGYMWSHPGKKLLFQGQEWAQKREWDENRGIDWDDLEGWEGELHRGIHSLTRTVNQLYSSEPALHELDTDPRGFSWIAQDDSQNSVLSYIRYSEEGDAIICLVNFSGQTLEQYRIGVPIASSQVSGDGSYSSRWEVILNTDDKEFEGAGRGSTGSLYTEDIFSHGCPQSLTVDIPAHSSVWIKAV